MRAIASRPLSLRTRLLAALLVFSAAGLAAFAVVTMLLLRPSLLGRVDVQLHDVSHRVLATGPPPETAPPEEPNRRQLPSDYQVAVLQADGSEAYLLSQQGSPASHPLLPRLDQAAVKQRAGAPFTVPDANKGSAWRVRAVGLPDGRTLVVALSLSSLDATVQRVLIIESAVGAGVLVLVGVVATVVVRVGLRPLTAIEHTAEAIAAGELDRRVVDEDPRTETGRLGAALNIMLGRLGAALREREQSEERLRRFVADASHELRTPLTSIRGFAELYRRGGATGPEDIERLMGRIEQEATRMGRLVEDLLLLARLDQERALDVTDVDLLVLAGDAVHDARAHDPGRPVSLAATGPVHVLGDENRLRQVVANLVTNALTHTPAGTPVQLSVRQQNTSFGRKPVATAGAQQLPNAAVGVLEVRDSGPGIPADQGVRVFDRFYRADAARTRKPDGGRSGSGLGLAISAAILEAHNGRIELHTGVGEGTTFRVLLPLA